MTTRQIVPSTKNARVTPGDDWIEKKEWGQADNGQQQCTAGTLVAIRLALEHPWGAFDVVTTLRETCARCPT